MQSEGAPSGARCPGRPGVLAACLVLLLLLISGTASLAQPAPATAPHAAATAPIPPVQAQQLLDLLNNPARRAAFIGTLTAMAKAMPVAAPAPVAHGKVTLAPDSLGSELLGEVGEARSLIIAQTNTLLRMFSDMLLATRWLHHELLDPTSRGVLLDAAWRGTVVMLTALLAERGLYLLLRGLLRRLARDSRIMQEAAPRPADLRVESPQPEPAPAGAEGTGSPQELAMRDPAMRGPDTVDALDGTMPIAQAEQRTRDATHRWKTLRLLRRAPFALLRLLLKLLPVGLFLVIGNVVGVDVSDHPITQTIIVTVTNLYGIGRVLYLALDMVLAARAPGVRLVALSDQTARLLSLWWAWLIAVPVVAVMVIDIGAILQLPPTAAQSLIRGILLVEHVLVAVLIWRVRHRVALALSPPRRFRTTAVGIVLSRMAERWWIVAMFFDFALWLVWAAQVRDGYTRILRLFLITSVVVFACRLVSAALLGLLDRLFRIHPELEHRFPGLERRANRYYPLLRRTVNGMVLVLGAVVLLQAWGVQMIAWLTGGALGTRLVSALISIALALVVGVAIWEGVNAALDRQISRFDRAAQITRAVRLQTLVPILRTVLFIVLATIISLTVLSEVGVNVAPLLAGAGILGVAIGFGSQKLVQDFITGIFLLVENAMQVGDTVTAAGVTGTVEHISIRTLRLRGGDGSVQIIPFSSVTTVINLSRDFAVAAIAISVSVEEDTDRVCALLRSIGEALRQDEAFARLMVDDFALNGVDSIGEYAVAISGTIKCTVDGRWPVQREFYRRLRTALHAEHISLPARPFSLPGALNGIHPEAEAAHGA